MWAGVSWRNDLSNSRALLRDNPYFALYGIGSCSHVGWSIVRKYILTKLRHSCWSRIENLFFFTGRLASCYMSKLKQQSCRQDSVADWTKTPSIFGQRILWRNQHSSTLRTPTLANCYIVVLCPRKMHQYALGFFKLYFIFVSFLFVPVQHSWFKWRSAQSDMNI